MVQIFTFVWCTLINLNFFNVDNERNSRRFESVYSKKVRAGKRRTYFFDVRRTKGDDFYLTLTESTKRFNSEGYERHKLFLYKEDFNRFLGSLEEVIDYVKTELMPDYDYDEYTRRHEEYEAERAAQALLESNKEQETVEPTKDTVEEEEEEDTSSDSDLSSKSEVEEDDMSW